MRANRRNIIKQGKSGELKREKNTGGLSSLLKPYLIGWEAYVLSNIITRDLQRVENEKDNHQSALILIKLYQIVAYINERILSRKKIETLDSMREALLNVHCHYVDPKSAELLTADAILKAEKSVSETIRKQYEGIAKQLFDRLEGSYKLLSTPIKNRFDTMIKLLDKILYFIESDLTGETLNPNTLEERIEILVTDFFKQRIKKEKYQKIAKENGIEMDALEEWVRSWINFTYVNGMFKVKHNVTQQTIPVKKMDSEIKATTEEDDYKYLLLEHIEESNLSGVAILLPLNTLKSLTEIVKIVSESDFVMKKPELSEEIMKQLHAQMAKLNSTLPSLAHSPHSTFGSGKSPVTPPIEPKKLQTTEVNCDHHP